RSFAPADIATASGARDRARGISLLFCPARADGFGSYRPVKRSSANTRGPKPLKKPGAADDAIGFKSPSSHSWGPRKSSSGNRSRFFGSGRALSGRFGIDARSCRGLVALGSLGSYAAFRVDLLEVLSKFDSPRLHFTIRSAWPILSARSAQPRTRTLPTLALISQGSVRVLPKSGVARRHPNRSATSHQGSRPGDHPIVDTV